MPICYLIFESSMFYRARWSNPCVLHCFVVNPCRCFISTLNLINNDTISDESPTRDQCILVCYSNIIEALRSANGATWISQALDTGLLPALLKSGVRVKRLPQSARDLICESIFTALHQYLPYRSVLRPAAKAFEMVERLHVSAENAGPLWDPWTVYHRAATTKLAMKEAFDQKYPTTVSAAMFRCMNIKVKRSLILYSTLY